MSFYSKLVEVVGEESAKEHMREIALKAKNTNRHFATLSKTDPLKHKKLSAKGGRVKKIK